MVRQLALAGVFASAALSSASATSTVTFTNKCSVDIDLYTRLASVYTDEHEFIAPGAAVDKLIGKGYEGHHRNGTNDAATLVEFATKGDLDLIWFDISIIPSRLKPGYEFCKSPEECKLHSESGIGFNTPVQVTPLSNTNGKNCRDLTCLADECVDAYNFPEDYTKTHSCPFGTDLVVTFCPSEDVTQEDVTQEDVTQEDETSGSQSITQEIVAPEPNAAPSVDSQTQEEVPSGDGNAYVQDDSVKTDEKPIPEVAQPPQPQPQPPAPAVTLPVVQLPQPEPPAPVATPGVVPPPNHCV